MISIFEVIILSIIQGITEWLPISSSGHLAIFQNIFKFQELSFDVFLHFASILAVILIFYKDIIKLLDIRKKENLRYICLIIVCIIPAGIIGFLFKNQIENYFSSLFYLGIFFIISGLIVYSTKFTSERKSKINIFDSIFIGIFQAVAILPGISRSGATISSGLFRGLSKESAVKFSFLISIPVVLGASLLEFKDLTMSGISYYFLLISFIITFFVSIVTIKILLRILKGDRFYLFGVYNFLLGILLLSYYYLVNF